MNAITKPETIEITNLDHFISILTAWHAQKVAVLAHMAEIPAGSEMECAGEKVVLEGDILEGFKAGIGLALMEMGTLPFAPMADDAEQPTAVNDAAKPC